MLPPEPHPVAHRRKRPAPGPTSIAPADTLGPGSGSGPSPGPISAAPAATFGPGSGPSSSASAQAFTQATEPRVRTCMAQTVVQTEGLEGLSRPLGRCDSQYTPPHPSTLIPHLHPNAHEESRPPSVLSSTSGPDWVPQPVPEPQPVVFRPERPRTRQLVQEACPTPAPTPSCDPTPHLEVLLDQAVELATPAKREEGEETAPAAQAQATPPRLI